MNRRVDFWLWAVTASVAALGAAVPLFERDWVGVAVGFFGFVVFGLIALLCRKAHKGIEGIG